MALLLPDLKGHKLPKGIAPICNRLKAIQSDDLVCRLALQIAGTALPEFFLLYKERHAYLVSVSTVQTGEVEDQLQGDLFESDQLKIFQDEFGLNQRKLLDDCYQHILNQSGHASDLPVSRWILFPNLNQHVLDRVIQVLSDERYTLIAKESCNAGALLALIEKSSTHATPKEAVDQIRQLYHSAELAPKAVEESKHRYGAPRDIFLDANQEWLVKVDLDLSEEGRVLVESGHRLVTGSAGSGKSVILLHRARLLAEMNAKHRILALTHNRPLNEYLLGRFGQLSQTASIEWTTFFSWVAKHSSSTHILKSYEQTRLLNNLLSQSSLKGRLTTQFIEDEFNWLTNNDISSRTDYLEINRVGRKRPLQTSMREEVFDLYIDYRKQLCAIKKTDWPGFALKFLQELRAGKIRIEAYDAIFIDEAQFFVPVWFECVRHALKPDGQLFMAADPTQGFLGSGQSWQQVSGLQLRGKSHSLTRPYRNTREIIEFAARFYRFRIADEEEAVNLPTDEQIRQLPSGTIPQLYQFSAPQDQIKWLSDQVVQVVEGNKRLPDQILVLIEDSAQVDICVDIINRKKPDLAVNAKNKGHSGKVRVCSMNAATGLEAPLVFVLGLDRIFEEESALQNDPEDTPERIHRNTRKIYMVLTRAMSELVICFHHKSVKETLLGSRKVASPKPTNAAPLHQS
ncbi:UvrD-helicase domain-containing protein [Coraliomargarita parva]|uniref:UvrD-helicase domain-containing protein n=1 Tax=Coraliomargarita parva TaxID=3014050 RepID=UPI0022B4A5ED|nr:UvrD-helicase domain-containing protein [Coraliomargarita parva]